MNSIKHITLLILFLLGGTVAATAKPRGEESGVKIDTIRYAAPGGYPLHLYLIRPAEVREKLPVIVYVPGSAWKKQRMAGSLKVMTPMARRGYAVACVEYRPCSVALFPAQVEDAKTATRFLRKNAGKYKLDSRNLFAWGSSSGGHTVLLQAFTQESFLLDPEPGAKQSCKVNAVIDYYGPSELVHEFRITEGKQENPDDNGGLLLGNPVNEKRDVALKASPLYYVNPYVVPVFVVQGEADKVVPPEQSRWLVARMQECGARVESLFLPEQGHGGKAFWTAELYDRCDAFLQSCRQ